jgi:NADPH:quinone reductase-like Zn-dependent oxidoreductase
MRAAVVNDYGVPAVGEFGEPQAGPGQAVLDVLAAGVNPVDVAIAAGTFYGGRPPLPFVCGREGVGLLEGSRVYFDAPVVPYGSMAERTLVDPASVYPLADGVSDGVGVAIGIAGLAAWLALMWRAKLQAGEHVLVLGASGIVGQIAVQVARLHGAGRVVAAARSASGIDRALALGADAGVRLDRSETLPAALAQAAGDRIDVVVDPVFGRPFVAALQAASFGARIVHLGTAAAVEATVPSPVLRGKALAILGHTNFAAPPEVRRESYERMADAAAAGEIEVEVDPLPLEMVAEAWRRMAAGSHHKVVLVP